MGENTNDSTTKPHRAGLRQWYPMTRNWIVYHLQEVADELQRTIRDLGNEAYSDEEFEVAVTHAYSHLNTAWNSRNVDDAGTASLTNEDFFRWRAFPPDIDLGPVSGAS
jgi:hypothetical protein